MTNARPRHNTGVSLLTCSEIRIEPYIVPFTCPWRSVWHRYACETACGSRRRSRSVPGPGWPARYSSGIGRAPWLSASVLGRVDEPAPCAPVSGFFAVHTQHVLASLSPRRPGRAWYGASASAYLAESLRGACWRCFSVAVVRVAFSWSWSSCLSWLVPAGRS